MNFNDTQREFEGLAKTFYELFDTMLSIYDKDHNLICGYPVKLCPFCSLLRTDKALMKRCLDHDAKAFDVCYRTQEPYIYHCHMGLIEVAAPVIEDGIVLGYLLFGQIADEEGKERIIEQINALEIGPSHDELLANLRYIKYHSPDYIRSMSKILVMSAAYVQLKGIFSRNRESFGYLISEYIQQNLTNDVSPAMICRHFGISRSSLYTLSKKHFGMGISDYINVKRINTAKSLLKAEKMPIVSVANAVGFSDSNYFTKVFKRYQHVTPKKYQLEHRIRSTPEDSEK